MAVTEAPIWRPRMQLFLFLYVSVLLSSMSVYNPPKGPAASKRNIIDVLVYFWLAGVGAHPKGSIKFYIHFYVHQLLSLPNSLKGNRSKAHFRQRSMGLYFGGQYIMPPILLQLRCTFNMSKEPQKNTRKIPFIFRD